MDALKFIKETPSDELIKNHLKVVFDTYYEIFGEVCTGCSTKIAGYVKQLKNISKTKIMSDKKRKFILKDGAQIIEKGSSNSYSNANLTDKIALKFLKKNVNRKVLFVKLPNNIDELIASKNKTTKETSDEDKTLKDHTVKQLKSKYPDAIGKNKTEIIASIEKAINAAMLNDEKEEIGTTKETSDEEE